MFIKIPYKLNKLLCLSLFFAGFIQIYAQPKITIQSGHQGMIRCLDISSDEKYLASGGADKNIIVWDIESEKKILTFTEHENWITALKFSPNLEKTLLASGDYDGTVKIWNLQTSKLEQEITTIRPYSITSLDFSPDGEKLAIAAGNKVSIWNIGQRRMQVILDGHNSPITKVLYGKDNFIFTSSLDGRLGISNSVTGEQKFTPQEKIGFAGVLSHSGKQLVAMAYMNGSIKILNSSNKKEIMLKSSFPTLDINKGVGFREFRLTRFVKTFVGSNSMLFLPDGNLIYNDGFKIRMWNYSSEKTEDIVDVESSLGSTSLTFSKKNNKIFYDDGEDIKAFDLASRKSHTLGKRFEAKFDMLAFGLKGDVLFGYGDNRALIITTDGKETIPEYKAEAIAQLIAELPNDFTEKKRLIGQDITVEVKGKNLLLRKSLENNEEVQGNNKENTDAIALLEGHSENIIKCWTDVLDNYIVSSGKDSKIILWDINARKSVKVFEGKPKTVKFSDNDEYLAIAGEDDIKIWNLKRLDTSPVIIKADLHRIVLFSPDNNYIATEAIGGTKDDIIEPNENESNIDKLWASAIGTINNRPRLLKIWDVKSGELVASLPMQTTYKIDYDSYSSKKVTLDPIVYSLLGWVKPYLSPSGSISFSPDEKFVVSDELDFFSGNSKIRVWNLSTKKEECIFEGHTSSIRRIIFSYDSKFVLSSGWDGTLKIWNIASKELKATILTSDKGWVIFTPEGRFDTNLDLDKSDDLTWLWNQSGNKPLPLRIFMRDYYEPRLFRKIMNEEPLSKVRDLASLNIVQPKVEILKVELDGQDTVKVTVEVSNVRSNSQEGLLNSGVFDVRLFRNKQLVAQSTSDKSINEYLEQIKPLNAVADRFERELGIWQRTHKVNLDVRGKAILTFEKIKLPKNLENKEVNFTAYAFNRDRVTSELSPIFKYTLPEANKKEKPRAYILTVGVDFNESKWSLSFAASSAKDIEQDIAAKFGKDYEVINVSLLSTFAKESSSPDLNQAKKENIHTILDILAGRVVSSARRQQLNLTNDLKAATPDDIVFVYIASHGFSDRYGNFFIIPSDPGQLYGVKESTLNECFEKNVGLNLCDDEKAFIANSISSSELNTWLQGIDASKMYMILDSCYSAAVRGNNFKPGPLGDRTFGQLAYDKRMTILTASQKSALSSSKLNGTLLSRTLLELMRKSPDTSLLYLLEETEYTVPKKYQTLYPKDNLGIQYPVLLDFSESEN